MKKTVSKIVAQTYQALAYLNLINQVLNRPLITSAVVRSVALILIAILLTPVFLFNPENQVQAQSGIVLPAKAPAPISAPPETFVIGTMPSSSVSALIVSSIRSITDYFSEPELPEGFEVAKVPTFREKIVSSISDSADSVFGISGSSSVKAVNATLKKAASTNISNNNSTNLLFGQLSSAVDFDFDGDTKADIARWHASNTEWKIKNSSNGNYQTLTLGSASAVIAPGDFDGDGTMDAATFNAGTWTIRKSSNAQTITISFGSAGDKPVVGDYDGDGKSDPAVFRPSTNTWWILYSSTATTGSVSFGASGDIPVQGKFDADPTTDVAVFRPSTGAWHVQGSTSGYYTVTWGNSYDIPVPADYTGDGKTDLAVYRGAVGTWYVLKSEDYSSYLTQSWGNYGDQPVPADYDGDSKADYSVWRPTTGMWYTIKSDGNVYDYQTLGVAGDTAISSAYLKQIGGLVYSYDFAKVRLSPKNSTGGTDLYSRNFSWSSGLVGLPGRAGLDAGFGISYNSLIWTKDPATNTIVFDADNSNMTPGFRMGFPTIEPVYFDSQTGKFAYIMVAPSGARVEFRQTAATNVYETADSSYTQLKINSITDPNNPGNPNAPAENLTIKVTNTSGTNMLYDWKNGAYRLQKIIDRNGNYIEVNHNADGQLQTVTDTLGRVINVNYTDGMPSSITQEWKDNNGQGANTVVRTWATFTYTTQAITTDFSVSGVPLSVVGPGGGYAVKVLKKITYPTASNGAGPHTVFDHNTWGQVIKVSNYAADNSSLNYVRTDLPANQSTSQSDCPRFTKTYTQAANFNGGTEVIVENEYEENYTFTMPDNSTRIGTRIEIKSPDGNGNANRLVTKIFSASSGWVESFPVLTEDWAYEGSGLVKKRWTTADWTQDNTNLTYIQNPRVTESKVGDNSNTQLTKTYYEPQPGNSNAANYGRVSKVEVYDATGTAVWKQIETTYNDNSAYLSRRMVNLPTSVKVSGFDQVAEQLKLVSFNTFAYDEGNFSDSGLEQNISSVIKHDNSNFSSSFITGRGNLTSTTRCDAIYSSNCTNGITSSVKYNIAGSIVAQISPASGNSTRRVRLSYTDNFNGSPSNQNTYAYPTKIFTPLDNNSEVYSEARYRFETGANVWAKSPAPAGNSTGKETVRLYDNVGRLERETLVNTGAYMRYEFPTNGIQSKVFSTIIDQNNDGAGTNDEVMSESWTDGAGRVRYSRTELPDSSGGFTGSVVEYDILGQVKRSTVPTEISVSNPNNPDSWSPAGDDALRGWLWTYQKYDWMGRVVRKISTDGNDSPTINDSDQLISYDGCGCAGGKVTTIQGALVPRDDNPNQSVRRTQKIYEDILGRVYKTENLKWNGDVYSTTLTTFNGRDQPIIITQQDNSQNPVVEQTVLRTYDGHGRLKTQHLPQQDTNSVTTYDYNPDDTISSVTDGRGISVINNYNNRKLLIGYNYYDGVDTTFGASFVYDSVGNRTSMTDRLGTVTYQYDSLSRMKEENRSFSEYLQNAPNGFKISYEYDLTGGLKKITDPYGQEIDYTKDKIGRLKTVTGSSWANNTNYVSNINYRAFGAIKTLGYSNNVSQTYTFDNRLQVNKFEVSTNGTNTFSNNYQYYSDGLLKFSGNPTNTEELFNRSYRYDHLGRLTDTRTGTEASGIPQYDYTKLPYVASYSYNAFGNVNYSQATWGDHNGSNNVYTNNKMSGWNYDSDGRMTGTSPTQWGDYNNYIYDFDGELSQHSSGRIIPSGQVGIPWQRKISQYRDGDGQLVKQNNYYKTGSVVHINKNMYFIRSSVLGGKVLTEASQNGSKTRTFVFANDKAVAVQKGFNDAGTQWSPSVIWQYSEPSEKSYRVLDANGDVQMEPSAELDMNSTEVGFEDPDQQEPNNNVEYNPYWSYGSPFTCLLDGVETPCNTVYQSLNNGSAERCPYNYCGPVTSDINSSITGSHTILRGPFQSFADGTSGYPLTNARDRGIYAGFLIEAGMLGAGDFANYFASTDDPKNKKRKNREKRRKKTESPSITTPFLEIFAIGALMEELETSAIVDGTVLVTGKGGEMEDEVIVNRVKNQIRRLVTDNKCRKAFIDNGFGDPRKLLYDSIVNKVSGSAGMFKWTIASAFALRDDGVSRQLGLDEKSRREFLSRSAPASTDAGFGLTVLRLSALTDARSIEYHIVHEYFHAIGYPGQTYLGGIEGLAGIHDLTYLKKRNYDAIIDACTK